MSNLARVLIFDIETSLGEAYFFQPKVRFINHKMVKHNPHMLCWAASWLGEKRIHSDMLTAKELAERDDSRIVSTLANLIQEADYILAHHGDKFDVPWVRGRLWANDLPPLGPVQTIDTKKLAARDFAQPHNNLEALAKVRGYGEKDKTDISWWIEIAEGNMATLKKMQKYNRKDVKILNDVYESMIPHVERLPRMVDSSDTVCPWCGNDVDNMQKRGKKRTSAYTYQRYWCKPPDGCGRYPKFYTHDRSNRSELRAT